MYSKVKIYNLALSALLLQRQLTNVETDASNEAKVLNQFWEPAYRTALFELDLDGTSTIAELELITDEPNPHWDYAYKYPSKCAFFRRIRSASRTDTRDTMIEKHVAVHEDQKAIFTDEADAVAEFISHDLPLSVLSAPAGLAIAYKLAMLSSTLITGKGAKTLIEQLSARYAQAKEDAQGLDRLESFRFEDDATQSEFVNARTT